MSGAKDGDKVVVRLTDFGGERKKPEGAVIEILDQWMTSYRCDKYYTCLWN